jgi:hypothetical protein
MTQILYAHINKRKNKLKKLNTKKKKKALEEKFYLFFKFIYSHVHTLFGPFLPLYPLPTPSLFPPPPLPFQAELFCPYP